MGTLIRLLVAVVVFGIVTISVMGSLLAGLFESRTRSPRRRYASPCG